MYLLLLNYHYIGEEEGVYPFSGIYPTSPRRLRTQLETIGRSFVFISGRDLVDAIAGHRPLPERSCLITFDDGLRSQYELALPILDDLRVPALFFVPAMPYATGDVVAVHKVHWCRAHLRPADFWKRIQAHYRELTGDDLSAVAGGIRDDALRTHYPYDENLDEARVKYLLGREVLPGHIRTAIVDSIFAELVPSMEGFRAELYLDSGMIRECARRDMLGSHGFAHEPLTQMSTEDATNDLIESRNTLASIACMKPKELYAVSYPYGLVNIEVADIARAAGFPFGVTVEASGNTTLASPLLLARVDTNDAPGGKRPKFSLEASGIHPLDASFTVQRRRYLDERVPSASLI